MSTQAEAPSKKEKVLLCPIAMDSEGTLMDVSPVPCAPSSRAPQQVPLRSVKLQAHKLYPQHADSDQQLHTQQSVWFHLYSFRTPKNPSAASLTLSAVAKTRSQLNRRLPDGQKLGWPPFGRAWYAGCTTLIIGNSLKAGIRMLVPDCKHNIAWAHRRCQALLHLTPTKPSFPTPMDASQVPAL